MPDYIYSSIAILAMVIHLIINFNLIVTRPTKARAAIEYRVFLAGIFAYYMVVAGWGIFAGLGWTRTLYVNTMLYYFAIALSVLLWCRTVIVFIDLRKLVVLLVRWFGYGLMGMYIVLLAVNIYNNCLFHFDANGNYHAGPLRLILFYPLIALNAVMAFLVLAKIFRCQNPSARGKYMVVFVFCLTMVMAIMLQIKWPRWPFYALGCLIGNCFVHIFLVESIRSELRQTVIEGEQTAKHMTELKAALDRARAAEKARSMFFSIVSHDIRTPLNAILGFSELLQNGVKTPDERDEALESIRSSGTTLLQLVNDVLDLAKMDAGKLTLRPVPVHLAQLTDEVFATFRLTASGKGIELVNRTTCTPVLMLDDHRFRQILFNLIGNAVKFTAKGSVTVSATYSGTVSATYSGTLLELAVSDTGCGIPKDMLEHILDPFVQVQDPSHSADRAGGTGLGLPICKSLIEAMGGELIVESEPGRGSTFRARIPGIATCGGKKAAGTGPQTAEAPEKLPGHVLVVDDSPVNRAVLTAFLKRAGITAIEQATDGNEALAKLDAAAQADQPYDFVLSDLWMPNLNGLEFIDKLRADPRFGGLPVFAVTADTESHQDARAQLFTGVLLKPLTYDKLLGTFAALQRA